MTRVCPVIFLVLALLLASYGCVKNQSRQVVPQPPERTWRDMIAASHGVIAREQQAHLSGCKAMPAAPVCVLINRAGAAENLANKALATYCQFLPSDSADKKCVPVSSALEGLQSAMGNLSDLTAQLQVLAGAGR